MTNTQRKCKQCNICKKYSFGEVIDNDWLELIYKNKDINFMFHFCNECLETTTIVYDSWIKDLIKYAKESELHKQFENCE